MILITGFPRSGTLYATRVLNAIGVNAEHESHVHNPAVTVSWGHFIYLEELYPEKIPYFLHQIRNPIKTISSTLTISPSNMERILTFLEVRYTNDSILNIMKAYVKWYESVENHPGRRLTYKVEEMESCFPQICALLKTRIKRFPSGIPQDTHTRKHRLLTYEELSKVSRKISKRIFNIARKYGYE